MDFASTATRGYGTWGQLSGTHTKTVEQWVVGYLPDDSDHYDVDAIVRSVCNSLNRYLPEGVTLEGEEVFGPAEGQVYDDFAPDTLRSALSEVDIDDIILRHTGTGG